jgi:hypothetical protein
MGQQSRSLFTLSFPAAPGAVARGRGVDFTGAQIAVAGAKGAGIARRDAAIGESFEATSIGTEVCEAGGVFNAGDSLAFDAQGRVVAASALTVAAGATAVTSTAANGAILAGGILPQWIVGDALEASSGAGVFVEVMLAR